MKKFIRRLLARLLFKLNQPEYRARQNRRKALLEEFIHLRVIPNSPEPGTTICYQDTKINLYQIDFTLPEFDFVIPRKNLFIKILDWRDVTYQESKAMGIRDNEWEHYQAHMHALTANFPLTDETKHLIVFRWGEEITPDLLESKFKAYL